MIINRLGRLTNTPKRVLVLGIALIVVGILITIFLPAAFDLLGVGFTGEGQETRVTISMTLRVLNNFVTPLGTSLVAASVVMKFLKPVGLTQSDGSSKD